MTEDQATMMDKIGIMERWITCHLRDDDKIRMNAKERREHINIHFTVSKARDNAKAILKYMQRGRVFDMPKEVTKEAGVKK